MRVLTKLGLTFLPTLGIIVLVLSRAPATAVLSASDLVVYDDALAAGWDNWSWDSTINFANTAPALGRHSIAVAFTSAWAGLSLHAPTPIDPQFYSAIQFWVYGGAGGTQLTFNTQSTDSGGNSTGVDLTVPAGVWTLYTVPLSALGNPTAIRRLNFQDRTDGIQPVFYVDDIGLVGVPANLTGTIRIDTAGPVTQASPLLLGSNIPAWLGPAVLSNGTLHMRTTAAGISLLRLPGGSWSDAYGWLSCELGYAVSGAGPCDGWYGWAARPTDFINLLRAQGIQGMWTVNINVTSKEAAAAVAFFNGQVTDTTAIGVDIHGTDWYTTGHWAALRVAHGNPEPIGIHYWEFGNEIYGGLPGHSNCQSWGWEATWTCDGTEYVNGVGSGSARHEGYLEFRAAMRAVDPSIEFGVSGVDDPASYANWGHKVIAAAGGVMDFYAIHPYAYNMPPPNTASGHAQILALPQTHWSGIRAALNAAFALDAGGRAIPVFVTEYNLTSSWINDNEQLMTRAVNALFIADSLGQMMQNGYAAAAQWDLANGGAPNGTDYGLMQDDAGFTRNPQYYAFPLWARFGATLLPVSSSASAATELSVYAGRVSPLSVTVMAVNKTDKPFTATITLNGISALAGGSADVLAASSLSSQSVSFNGVANPNADLSDAPSQPFATGAGHIFTFAFAPYSVTLLKINVANIRLDNNLYLPLLQH
jgi:hypothetical protein